MTNSLSSELDFVRNPSWSTVFLLHDAEIFQQLFKIDFLWQRSIFLHAVIVGKSKMKREEQIHCQPDAIKTTQLTTQHQQTIQTMSGKTELVEEYCIVPNISSGFVYYISSAI